MLQGWAARLCSRAAGPVLQVTSRWRMGWYEEVLGDARYIARREQAAPPLCSTAEHGRAQRGGAGLRSRAAGLGRRAAGAAGDAWAVHGEVWEGAGHVATGLRAAPPLWPLLLLLEHWG